MPYKFFLLLVSLMIAIENSDTNASDADEPSIDACAMKDCKSLHKAAKGTSVTHSSSSTPEEDSLSDPEFERLIQLPIGDLNEMGEGEIKSLGMPTLENLYWESTSKHLREEPAKKAALCRIAAIGGYPVALGEYANMLFSGRGVLRNPRESLNWYLKSAQAENEESITFLQRLLEEKTIFSDFNVTDVSEHAAITSSIEEAYEKLQSRWEMEE